MAEFGAHLATAASELPSIFEVLAQENLTTTLRPAFAHLIKVLVQLDPGRLGVFWRWHDEIFLVLDVCLQHYCLKAFGASFAENFYGLKRLPIGKRQPTKSRGYRLPLPNHKRALFCLAVAPYLKSKLDGIYEKCREEASERHSSRHQIYEKVLCLFTKIYPIVHLSWEMAMLGYQIKYALGRTTFPSPLYRLAGTQLVTLTDEDDTNHAFMRLLKDVQVSRWTNLPAVVISHLKSNGRELLTSALSMGTFFLQFLEWWYENRSLPTENSGVALVSPPDKVANVEVPTSQLCPICLKTRTNDTVLPVSGYVFCYPCIYRYVQQKGTCPVTNLPASSSSLVRLFAGNSTN